MGRGKRREPIFFLFPSRHSLSAAAFHCPQPPIYHLESSTKEAFAKEGDLGVIDV